MIATVILEVPEREFDDGWDDAEEIDPDDLEVDIDEESIDPEDEDF